MDNQSISLTTMDEVLERKIREVCSKMFVENVRTLKQNLKDLLMNSYLTIQQVSDILGKDEKTIRRYEKKGHKSYFIGRTRIYFEDDVLAFIESMGRVKNV